MGSVPSYASIQHEIFLPGASKQPHLYPNAALKMITHATTAFGVPATSRYNQYPVAPRAMHICETIISQRISDTSALSELTTAAPDISIGRRPQRSTRIHLRNALVRVAGRL